VRLPSNPPSITLVAVCVFAACSAAVFCGCSNADTVFGRSNRQSDIGTIRIDGSSTVYPISASIAEMFSEQRANSRVVVGYHGTGGGMKKFIAGEIDICNASREM